MLYTAWSAMTDPSVPAPQEGELYRTLALEGNEFPIYYGYYEQCDRENPEVEPMPIYPNFREHPQYTPQGWPYVTQMQDACQRYNGPPGEEQECAECRYFRSGVELLGTCTCPANRKPSADPAEGA